MGALFAQNAYLIDKKATPNVVQSGQTVTYQIDYSTAGAVTNLVITETVPAGFTITSASKPYTQLGNILTFALGSFAGGASTIYIYGTFACGTTCNNTVVIDTASISADFQPTKTDTAKVTITATNPWKIEKIPVTTYSGGIYYGALGGTVRYMIILYKNTYCWGCTGELNLNTTQVADNIGPNAVIVGVLDQSLNPVTYSSAGTTHTWNSGNLLATGGLGYYYDVPSAKGYCYSKIYYIDVKYPCANGFVNGQIVPNIVTLNGTLPCSIPATTKDTSKVTLADPSAKGNFGKTNNIHWYPNNKVPGCSSSYGIGLSNTGSIPLTNITLTDTFPNSITVTNVSISSSNYPLNFFYQKQIGNGIPTGWISYASNPINVGTNITAASICTGGEHIYSVKVTSNNIGVGGYLNVSPGYTILTTDYAGNPVNPGYMVKNCANITYKGNTALIDSAGCVFGNINLTGQTSAKSCDTFYIISPKPQLNVYKYVCTSKGCYKPGDTARYHLLMYNGGSGPLTAGATLNDILATGLTFAGNVSWYKLTYWSSVCATGAALPGTPTANHTGNNLQWILPAGLSGSCGGPIPEYWYCDFDVVINNNAAAGSIANQFTVSGGGLGSTSYSNQAFINICPLDSLISEKLVSIDGGTTWQTTATLPPGGVAKFRCTIKNVGTVPVTDIKLVDILPSVGDYGVVNYTFARNSKYNMELFAVLPVPTGGLVAYSSSLNPCRATELGITVPGCTGPGWNTFGFFSPPAIRSFKVEFGSFILGPAQVLYYDFDVKVPMSAPKDSIACNSFGFRAKKTNVGTYTLAAEVYPYPCVKVGEDTTCNCQGSKWGDVVMNAQGIPPKIIACGNTYNVICNKTYIINASYICADPHCPASVQYKLKKPDNSIVTGTVPVPFTASMIGTYTLTLYGMCGNRVCDSCVIVFKTDCKDDGCTCEGSSWGPINLSWNDIIDQKIIDDKNNKIVTSDGTGMIPRNVMQQAQQVVPLNCNNPAGVGPPSLPCNKTFTITGSFNCIPANCGKLAYTITYPNGSYNSGTLGSLTFTTSQTGWYSISFFGMCGTDTCKVCVWRFKVDCGEIPPECPCPYTITVKKPTVTLSTLAAPPATIAASTFGITGPTGPLFTEIRAEVVSYDLFSNFSNECLNCKSYPYTWASVYQAGPVGVIPPKITMFNATASSFNPAGNGMYQNPREVIWNNNNNPFALPTSINMQFLLPNASIIDCCELTARICVKFTFRDIKCKECEVIVCFDVVIKKPAGGGVGNNNNNDKGK